MASIAEAYSGWTYGLVEERLIEAMALWRRSPGEGASPYASDGPWHLIRKEWSDWDARDPKPLRSLPLARAEVARRDEASAWVARYVGDRDRRLVGLVLLRKGNDQRVDWRDLLRLMGLAMGVDGLRRRYERAVQAVCKGLDRDRVPVQMALSI